MTPTHPFQTLFWHDTPDSIPCVSVTPEAESTPAPESKVKKIRSRLWNVLLYPDNESHVNALSIISKEFQHVGILHDKDTWDEADEAENPEHKAGTFKKSHYHIVLKFTQARWNTAIAADLGITTNFLEQCRNFDASAVYLVHDGLPDKFQYDTSELFGSLVPAVMKLLADTDENSRVLELMKLIREMGHISYEQLVIIACQQGMYGDLRRMGYILSRIVDEHNAAFEREFQSHEDVRRTRSADLQKFADFEEFTSPRDVDKLPPI